MAKGCAIFTLALLMLLMGIPYLVVQVRSPGNKPDLGVPPSSLPIAVYLPDEKQVIQLPLEEYIKGVVAAEMPAQFSPEALKAQSIVARTYLVRSMPAFGGNGCDASLVIDRRFAEGPPPEVVDICADARRNQAWLSQDELRERWGLLGYWGYWAKISRAVDETRGLIVVYGNEPIDAVYHAASGGKTENARDVWGNDVPYLKSVASPFEEQGNYRQQILSFDLSEAAARLGMAADELRADARAGRPPVEILRRSSAGRALQLRVGSRSVDAASFRELLGLPSTWIETIELEGRNLKFVIRGYGHGVGLSQYGAEGMARRGESAEDIIRHYYSGVHVRQIFAE